MTAGSSPDRIALFPLHTVLFPGCTLPLQIFEQRYLRLVKTCLKNGHGFVVILISTGKEVGDSPDVFTIGCYVDIVDWEALDNGLLGITIEGRHRVQISNPCAQDDGLLMASIKDLSDIHHDSDNLLLEEYTDLVDTLKHLAQHPFVTSQQMKFDFNNCTDICNKLSYLLPISNQARQSLLEMEPLRQRMSALRSTIAKLQT